MINFIDAYFSPLTPPPKKKTNKRCKVKNTTCNGDSIAFYDLVIFSKYYLIGCELVDI